ncbi:MAG: YlmC/YmxH family sporulation protein [Candidatus Limivicinus sp.]
MLSYFSDLRYKEVIDIHTGLRLGYVCDMEFDDSEGRLVSLVTPGRSKFFGLLGREDDYVLPWGCIVRVGGDIILVEAKGEFMRRKRQRRPFF